MTHKWGMDREQESEDEEAIDQPDMECESGTDGDSGDEFDEDFQRFYNLERQYQEQVQVRTDNQDQDGEYSEDDDSGSRQRKGRRTI